MVICQGFLHVWLSIWNHGNSFAQAVSSRHMATVHAPVPALSCSRYTVYLHILQMQMCSLFSACAISPILPEMSGSQCMNWPSLQNLHPQLLERDEPYKINLNIDNLCLIAAHLFGKNSHSLATLWGILKHGCVSTSKQSRSGYLPQPQGKMHDADTVLFPQNRVALCKLLLGHSHAVPYIVLWQCLGAY